MLNVIIDPLGCGKLPALALMPRLPATLLTTLLLRTLTLPRATLLPGQRRIVRRRQRTVRRITLQQPIVLIHPLPQRPDLRQQSKHQLNRGLSTRPRDPFRIRNTHERKIPCDLKESSRSPRPHVNAYANKIFIAGIDGSGLTALVMNGVNGTVLHPTGLAIDSSGTLYWANSDDGTIWELPHAGSVTPGPAAQLLAVPGSPVGSLHGLAVDGRYIYWADQNNNEIGRALLSNPSGTNVVTNFISGSTVNTPFGVTVDPGDTHIYWSNQVSDGSVGKAAIDGSGANIFISPGAGAIRGVAVDGGYVYYAFFSYAGGSIARSPLSGVGATQVVSDSGQYTSGLWASRPTVGAPSIGSQSTYAVGTTLTAYPNASDPSGTTYTYQWYDCDNGGNNCSPISNAGSGHYTIQSSDIGHDIKVSVTGVDSTGAEGAPRFSSPVGPRGWRLGLRRVGLRRELRELNG